MTNITLFDAAAQVRSVFVIDAETGEIDDSYTASRALFEQKGTACIAYAKDEAATIAAAEAMLKKAGEQVQARKNRLARFEAYMFDCMAQAGIDKLESADGLLCARIERERDEAVEIDEDTDVPLHLCLDPKPPAPSKTKIKDAIKAGEPVPAGCRIVRRDRHTIK